MPNIPGTMMSDEPFTLTTAQIDALNSLPPGFYLVCSGCRRFCPAPITVTFVMSLDGGALCEGCAKKAGL